MKEQLANAIAFAAEKHKGQFDKGGNPYILHPIAVMKLLETEDQELMAIAMLHDIVEDCKVTYEQLEEAGFTNRILAGVHGMTKIPGESIKENLDRMKKNQDVVLVKMADLRHNSDLLRLKGIDAKDILRMNKYINMYHDLAEFLKGKRL